MSRAPRPRGRSRRRGPRRGALARPAPHPRWRRRPQSRPRRFTRSRDRRLRAGRARGLPPTAVGGDAAAATRTRHVAARGPGSQWRGLGRGPAKPTPSGGERGRAPRPSRCSPRSRPSTGVHHRCGTQMTSSTIVPRSCRGAVARLPHLESAIVARHEPVDGRLRPRSFEMELHCYRSNSPPFAHRAVPATNPAVMDRIS